MTQPFRLVDGSDAGRLLDRSRPLRFSFDGRELDGMAGDTLASALLASGVRTVARSFKYGRRRGIFAAGAEEPNAIVRVGEGARAEPNLRATQVELLDGMVAGSQNRWPTLDLDVGALRGCLGRLIPAGFYYKTFMWPRGPRWWLRYEHAIRRAAGMGVAPTEPDPDVYEHRFAACDLLVVGAGPAGLAAALAACRAGARVMIVDESAAPGGRLLESDAAIEGRPGWLWAREVTAECARTPGCRVLLRTTAFGWYDQNLVGLFELRAGDPSASDGRPRSLLWKVRAREIVLATGAIERPIAFQGNDLPGVMLAHAMRRYADAYAVAAGRRIVLFGNHDGIHDVALRLHALGVGVRAVIDARPAGSDRASAASAAGIDVHLGHGVVRARGGRALQGVEVAPVDASGQPDRARTRTIECDGLGISGGWNPAVHLYCHAGGRLRFDEALSALVPLESGGPLTPAGSITGDWTDGGCLRAGHAAAVTACARLGLHHTGVAPAPRALVDAARQVPSRLWVVRSDGTASKAFVDLQNDVTVDDIDLAIREGYRSVEHLKRYTTLGMGTDQGRTSNVLGLALLAERTGRSIAEVGITTFRPPYTPVPLGVLAGREVGAHAAPVRLSPLHDWHVAHGAKLINVGLWKRAQFYPSPGEGDAECIAREARNVRTGVGLVDVSTLGKIELQGPDTADFLGRVYANRWDTLRVGRCRYGLMLREDGFVLDDGTTARLGSGHYLMTTTTANAARVMQHLEFLLQTVWPSLDVHVYAVTEQWAAMALAGPRSRDVLAAASGVDVSNDAIPFLACGRIGIAGVDCRYFRITYSGELAYEIHSPAGSAQRVWQALLDAGEPQGARPYGTEAMGVLRIEKGHVSVGAEIDGRTTADDLGLGQLVSPDKDCIGRRSLTRPGLVGPGRWQLVGLLPERPADRIPPGAKLVESGSATTPAPAPIVGHVTSTCWSPTLERSIALALLADGRSRHGQTLRAASPLAGLDVPVRVCEPCFIDPEGLRARQ
jgi:sarcosine oxidase subunit alpha